MFNQKSHAMATITLQYLATAWNFNALAVAGLKVATAGVARPGRGAA
jgi:hypothetical protein